MGIVIELAMLIKAKKLKKLYVKIPGKKLLKNIPTLKLLNL